MSRERSGRKQKLNRRASIIKGPVCQYCNNDKMHSDGARRWCTKCKKDKVMVVV